MKYTKSIIPKNGGRIIFLSDLHYGHSGIIKFCPETRKFKDIPEMNNWIRSEIFQKFTDDDYIFDLGDTFWKHNQSEISEILENTKGKKFKLIGNHDSAPLYWNYNNLGKYYEIVSDILDISIPWEGQNYMLTLSHYPITSWNHKSWGSLMLHGHCHGSIDSYNDSIPDLRVDVGIDGNLAKSLKKPWIEFKDILNFFNNKTSGVKFSEYVKNNVLLL